jgi:polysaccharide export outer membrane protein
MNQRKRMSGRLLLAVCVAVCWPAAGPAQTAEQSYRLGSGDVLQLTVPQQPDLSLEFTVGTDGTASIGRLGAVPLAGLTVSEAQDLIRQRLRLFDPSIGEASLTVVEHNALRVFVLGAVANPGIHTFVEEPTLWDAIRAAGGPLDTANLTVVRCIHQQGTVMRSQSYDLSAIFSGQATMPDIRLGSGDTVVIPLSEGAAVVPPEVGVQVFGGVGTPATVPISEPTRLLTLIMLAGTPVESSRLDEVWWVHREGQGQYRSTRVNLSLFLKEGSLAGNPLVYPGDTVQVTYRGSSWFRDLLSYAGSMAAIFLAIDRISRD